MAYITRADLEEELGEEQLIQLTSEANAGEVGEVDDKRVQQAINFAEGTFDTYARTRYTLPVPATPKVKSLCLDLAIYHLRRRRVKSEEGAKTLKSTLYDPSIKFLEALQANKVALDVPAAEETTVSPANPSRVLKGGARVVFDDENLRGF